MISSLLLLAVSAVVCLTEAQSSTYVESAVPTGTPIPGDYTGALRPQIHYSPPRGFMVSRWLCILYASTSSLSFKGMTAIQGNKFDSHSE